MVDLNELRNNYILIILVLVSYHRVSWGRELGAESWEQRAGSREQGAESWEQAGLESGALQQSGQSGQRCGAGNISQGHLSAMLCHGIRGETI